MQRKDKVREEERIFWKNSQRDNPRMIGTSGEVT